MLPKVRSRAGTPTVSDFVSADGSPLVQDDETGQWWGYANGNPYPLSQANVMAFGATGDGVTDDSPAFIAALTAMAGKALYIPDPSVAYLLQSGLGTIPANTRLIGANKRTTKITKAFNGLVATLAGGVSLTNLYFEGDGNNFTGGCLQITGTDGNQTVEEVRMIDFDGPCLEFTATTAGSRSEFNAIDANRVSAGTGTGRYAFVIADAVEASAVPRKFDHIETGGTCAFSFGGANDLFITSSFLGDLAFSDNSRSVHIAASRLANQAALTISGGNHTMVACDVLAQITLDAGLTASVIGPCSFNTLPMVDNSASATNQVFHTPVNYTPTLTSGGVQPVLAAGTMSGIYWRSGSTIHWMAQYLAGAGDTLGTGDLRISLPVARASSYVAVDGNMRLNPAGTNYTATAVIPGAVGYASFINNSAGAGSVTATIPGTPVAGNTYIAGGSYAL